MLLKTAIIVIVIVTTIFSLWKNSVGLFVPLAALWGYGVYDGFSAISFNWLIILTVVHAVIQGGLFWYSNKYREANLTFTGAGITGFSTAVLASLFFGALLGFFMWWGFIGRLVSQPITIGIKPIVKSFIAGFLKVVYALLLSGIVAYSLF